jgi:cyclopropane-fatty-acyl-phospholipid synthase
MLDQRMQYSCAYWKGAKNLNEAQENKLELICKKLMLKKSDRVLDIGSGFGGFAKYAAERYGCHVTGYNISKEQIRYSREICKGLPVEIVDADYREIRGQFDKVVSVGFFEHVGYRNYRALMGVVHRCLNDDGLFLLHTIGTNTSRFSTDPWLNKYIFPNSMLPSVKEIGKAVEGLFVMEDWHNFGPDYDKTLLSWSENFDKSWATIKSKYGGRFYRMWKYYLLLCASHFRSRHLQLWQIVLSKGKAPYPVRRTDLK